MLELGSTDFYLDIPNLSRSSLEKYSIRLFDEWESRAGDTISLPDYALELVVEEGSIKGKGLIATAALTLLNVVAHYGSFIQGIQIIQSQVKSVGAYLGEHAGLPFKSDGVSPQIWSRGGTLSKLQRLFVKVQNRQLTPEQATAEAEAILGSEAAEAPELMNKIAHELRNVTLYPKQLLLSEDQFDDEHEAPDSKKSKSRPAQQRPILPPISHLEVRVWRESKKGKRNVRVSTK